MLLSKEKIAKYYGNIKNLCSVKHVEYKEGKEKGVEAYQVNNGSGLFMEVLPSRCMDISYLSYKGIPVSYLAPSGIVAPEMYDKEGFGWLKGFFAGMLTTCGLDNVGGPAVYNNKTIGDIYCGLHGSIANTPAEQLGYTEGYDGEDYKMTLSGSMCNGFLHGTKVTLKRDYEIIAGKNAVKIKDTILNEGVRDFYLTLLYHINVGYPILSEDAKLYCKEKTVKGNDDFAQDDIKNFKNFHKPTIDIAEKCYFIDFEDDNVEVAIINEKIDLGFYVRYNKNHLPRFCEWKMMGEEEYVLGIEPGLCNPLGLDKIKELL
ncbi:MAG: DUF4432 family protein [Clostridiales bacterium]|nr:DUF4432 family protein [Clostridiales bacterium]MBE5754759.1 DUF4432 family protein [Clostridiales bacterium]